MPSIRLLASIEEASLSQPQVAASRHKKTRSYSRVSVPGSSLTGVIFVSTESTSRIGVPLAGFNEPAL